jgi:hypothetical protein
LREWGSFVSDVSFGENDASFGANVTWLLVLLANPFGAPQVWLREWASFARHPKP